MKFLTKTKGSLQQFKHGSFSFFTKCTRRRGFVNPVTNISGFKQGMILELTPKKLLAMTKKCISFFYHM